MFAYAVSSGSPWRTLCALPSRTTASPTNTICAVPARPPSKQIAYCLHIRSVAARGMRIDLIWVSRNCDNAGLSQYPVGRERRHGIGLDAARCCEMDDQALRRVRKASSCMSLVVYLKQPLCGASAIERADICRHFAAADDVTAGKMSHGLRCLPQLPLRPACLARLTWKSETDLGLLS